MGKYVYRCDYCNKGFKSPNKCEAHELECKNNPIIESRKVRPSIEFKKIKPIEHIKVKPRVTATDGFNFGFGFGLGLLLVGVVVSIVVSVFGIGLLGLLFGSN